MRVLLAEDNVPFRSALVRMIAALGHEVRAVPDGTALIAAAAALQPDLVLSDVDMPGCDGVLACRALRDAGLAERFVLMSGDPASMERARRAGFGSVLVKPFPLEDLAAMLAP